MLNKMSVGTKVAAGFAMLLLILAISSGVSYYRSAKWHRFPQPLKGRPRTPFSPRKWRTPWTAVFPAFADTS